MASAWDKARERSEQASEGVFLRLENDGDKAVILVRGEPEVREQVWNTKLEKYEDFTEDHKKLGKTPKPKFLINVFAFSVTEADGSKGGKDATPKGEKRALIWDMNNSTFKDLLKVSDKYGLATQIFEVERKGKKGDKQTTYSILPERTLTEEDKKEIGATPMHDLTKTREDESTDTASFDKKKGGGEKEKSNGSNGASAPADTVITKEQGAVIVERLKKQPRPNIDAFLTKFGVAQVKLLKPSQLQDAMAMLAGFEGPATPPAEVDPFAG
jgi:hypothetical protein